MPLLQETDRLVEENMGLVSMAVKRYMGFGVDYEDLMQIGSIGLLKAARGFDPDKNIKFSTYAVAKIIGEIKTYLRDNGAIKISRSVKEQKLRIDKARNELIKKLGHEPQLSEIASLTNLSVDEVVYALDATRTLVSLDLPADEGGVEAVADSEEDKTLDRVLIAQAVSTLEPKARRVITLRYFCDKTQAQTAKALGMSQVTVSRIERKTLEQLKKALGP